MRRTGEDGRARVPISWALAGTLVLVAVGTLPAGCAPGDTGNSSPPQRSGSSGSSDTSQGTIDGGSDAVSPDGEALVGERCTRCHDLAQVQKADHDRRGWTKTVDRMIGYGAQLNEDERGRVIGYLASSDAADSD